MTTASCSYSDILRSRTEPVVSPPPFGSPHKATRQLPCQTPNSHGNTAGALDDLSVPTATSAISKVFFSRAEPTEQYARGEVMLSIRSCNLRPALAHRIVRPGGSRAGLGWAGPGFGTAYNSKSGDPASPAPSGWTRGLSPRLLWRTERIRSLLCQPSDASGPGSMFSFIQHCRLCAVRHDRTR